MHPLTPHIQFANKLTRVMDLRFNFFGIRFGIDPLLDVIPGLGNFLATATSCYLLWIAYKLQVPQQIYLKMIGNIMIDSFLGMIPVVGAVADVFYRANVRNYALLEKYFDPSVIEGEIVE